MGVGGNLLEEVALARPARAKFDQIVVALHEGDHAQERRVLGAGAKRGGLQADTAQEEVFPFARGKLGTTGSYLVQYVARG